MKTYKERLIAGLKAMGYVEDPNDRSKYVAFKDRNSHLKLFVGNAGALRKGRCASDSFSLGDPSRQTAFYQTVLLNGDATFKQKVNLLEGW